MSTTSNLGPGFPSPFPALATEVELGAGGVLQVPANDAAGFPVGIATVGGTIANGDTVTIQIGNVAITTTMVTASTFAAAAATLATQINANGTLTNLVTAHHGAGQATLSVTSKTEGPSGMLGFSASHSGTTLLTVSGTELDFQNGIVVSNQTFSFSDLGGGGSETYYAGVPAIVSAAAKAEMKAEGLVY